MEVRHCMLVPELCVLTGLTENILRDFKYYFCYYYLLFLFK